MFDLIIFSLLPFLFECLSLGNKQKQTTNNRDHFLLSHNQNLLLFIILIILFCQVYDRHLLRTKISKVKQAVLLDLSLYLFKTMCKCHSHSKEDFLFEEIGTRNGMDKACVRNNVTDMNAPRETQANTLGKSIAQVLKSINYKFWFGLVWTWGGKEKGRQNKGGKANKLRMLSFRVLSQTK